MMVSCMSSIPLLVRGRAGRRCGDYGQCTGRELFGDRANLRYAADLRAQEALGQLGKTARISGGHELVSRVGVRVFGPGTGGVLQPVADQFAIDRTRRRL